MQLSPQDRYQLDLQRTEFRADASQANAVKQLQDLYLRLVGAWEEEQKSSIFKLLTQPFQSPSPPIRGLYFWGGVGRGKTYLMDNFYESLPFPEKMRMHFHRFMRRVHAELKKLAGEKNPLKKVADNIRAETRVICFDEFFVSDITDAMILGTLMQELFTRGVTLVATSNIVPDNLYKDGLQRERFLPAIELIKIHTQIINVDGGVDYRLRSLEQAQLFHTPLGDKTDRALQECFNSLLPINAHVKKNQMLEIEGRLIPSRYESDDIVWFDFVSLCDGPRSQNDYIELAREYHTVIISNIPELTAKKEDQARRFINLVDEFYDRQVKLVLSSEKNLEAIYSGQRLVFEFQRTVSRLLEMQSKLYLEKPHRPE